MPENGTSFAGFRQGPGGNFAFTMVPNQFLDEIVPFEKPCVTKVVCLILRRTLGWIDERGQRRQQDQVAYSEFAREMNMSMQAVADGLKAALEKGYIVRVKPGTLRGPQTGAPEGAWYGLRWAAGEPGPRLAARPEKQSSESHSKKQSKGHSRKQSEGYSEKQSEGHSEKQSSGGAEAALKIRDMRNKAESKTKLVEIKASSSDAKTATPAKFSVYIGNVVTEIGESLGDAEHRLPNIKHALNLWDAQTLSEREFVGLLYQARDKTRACTNALSAEAVAKPKTALPASWQALAPAPAQNAGPRNRMPYFFRVLEGLVRGGEVGAEKKPETRLEGAGPDCRLPGSESQGRRAARTNPAREALSGPVVRPEVSSATSAVSLSLSAVALAEALEAAPSGRVEATEVSSVEFDGAAPAGTCNTYPQMEVLAGGRESKLEISPALSAAIPPTIFSGDHLRPFPATTPPDEHAPTRPATPPPDDHEHAPILPAATPPPDEHAPMRRAWAERWSRAAETSLAEWEAVLAGIEDDRLRAIARRSFGLEARLAEAQLLARLRLKPARPDQLDIIIFFRNAFDARYAASYMEALAGQLERQHGQGVRLWPVCV